MGRRQRNYAWPHTKRRKEDAKFVTNLLRGRDGVMENYIIRSSNRTEVQTPETANGTANPATPQLTESEKSKLMVIKREVGRGYALTMQDLRFLVEIVERCGL